MIAQPTSKDENTPTDSGKDRVHWIRPAGSWQFLDLRELWEYKELIYFLTWRDIKVRYKQTVIGVAWALLQPLAMMVVFNLIFGRLAKIPSEGIPYPLFAYTGLLPWQVFSRTIPESAGSLVKDHRLISKVYFPRIIIPLSATLAALLDFFIASGLLVVLMIFYGTNLSAAVFTLPFFVLLMLITALGIGFWLSATNVEYRDVMHLVPFLTQFLLFITPVVYPSAMVPDRLRIFYGLNPMVGVVEGFRWALLGVGEGPSPMLGVSVAVALALFISGMVWFRRRESHFADVLGT